MSTKTADGPLPPSQSTFATSDEKEVAIDCVDSQIPLLFDYVGPDLLNETGGSHARYKTDYRTPIQEKKLQLMLSDAICVSASMILAFATWIALEPAVFLNELPRHLSTRWFWAPMGIGLWVFSAWLTDLYDVAVIGVKRVVAQRVVMSSLISLCVVLVTYFLAPNYVPRTFLLLNIALAAPLVVLFRAVLYSYADRNPRHHRLLLLGSNNVGSELGLVFANARRLNHSVVARADESSLAKVHFESNGEGLLDAVRRHGIDEIVVEDGISSDEVFQLLVQCQSNGIRVSSMPEVYRKLARRIPIQHVSSTWVLRAFQDHILFTRSQLFIKRFVDIAGGLAGLPVFLLTFPVIAVAIKSNSKGPVFYCQERTGRGGKSFWIIKYRTMGQDAESDGKARWSGDDDPRITKVGKFLRKTRLDEIPQIINVVRGEMSLVGPRPERPQIEEMLNRDLPHYFIRRLVKPGITGWAQVHYKYGNTLRDSSIKLEYDTYYVRYWSLFMDLYVVFRTILVVLRGGGK